VSLPSVEGKVTKLNRVCAEISLGQILHFLILGDDTKKRKSKWDISAAPAVIPPIQVPVKTDPPPPKKPKQ